jgi:NADH:ubiquinone oxidoreductase subunit K
MDLLNHYFKPCSSFLALFLGIISMLLTNTLWLEYHVHPRPGVLICSAVLALVAFSDRSLPFWKTIFYFILMTFFIITVAVGTQTLVQTLYIQHYNKETQNSFSVPFLGDITVNTKPDSAYRRFFDAW